MDRVDLTAGRGVTRYLKDRLQGGPPLPFDFVHLAFRPDPCLFQSRLKRFGIMLPVEALNLSTLRELRLGEGRSEAMHAKYDFFLLLRAIKRNVSTP
jgi:hypothetical protein